jgi:glutamate-ammonia-ligase adenylyltransferase
MIVGAESATLADAVARARAYSPFLRMLLEREPVLAAGCQAGRVMLDLDSVSPDAPVGARLRRQRRALALVVGIGDLAGALDFPAVTAALTRFADGALDQAIRAAIAERSPGRGTRGFVAIALGKQGSGELNYSSDIDPILLYDPETVPRRPREEPGDAAIRIARRVVELLQARDADGYVLRVDLRLRPSPEVTPIALPVDAAIMKARPCLGNEPPLFARARRRATWRSGRGSSTRCGRSCGAVRSILVRSARSGR